MQHHLHQMRPRTSRGSALRRRISIRREESHLRLARSTVALLQSGGNSRLQVSSQSTFAQRCCQVLALPEVTCSYETIVFAVAIVFNDILFINASEIYSMGMRLIYMGVRRATNNGWIVNDHRSSYAKCRLFCWGLSSVVEMLFHFSFL